MTMIQHSQQQRTHWQQHQCCHITVQASPLAYARMQADKLGLGFMLQQSNGTTWNLIQAGSHFLTDTESRYVTIELEMLAVCWAVMKCNLFLAGLQHFSVITDHNTLIQIINNCRLDEIENPRLQRLKTKLMAYNFTAEWINGKKNDAPNALSCNPLLDPEKADTLAEIDTNGHP